MNVLNSDIYTEVEYEKGVLILHMKKGGVIAYDNVPEYTHTALICASSPDKYIKHFIENQFPRTFIKDRV